ncbi:hypothetical protein PMI16_04001 [Herbaspirillum sp. CF444]|uniref:hypothetical protein n=1 Tax=Herbaspirillum sp. CF444 TaxID=1144319 RepID=UPI000272799F|nr:hypothetical protein [Herbaspirillum sp. CF444]EJL84260.1 hypothetical protein PMI16_04001 [Herbaspirillum sp. CF444]
MQRTKLLMTVLFTTSCGAASAATPLFEIDTNQDRGTYVQAIDAYPASVINPLPALPGSRVTPSTGRVSAASVVFGETDAARDTTSLGGQLLAVGYSPALNSPLEAASTTSTLNITDDSLFYFLQDFQAQPLQKPARWSLFLLGIGFLLYQIRPRSMRASIGFPPASISTAPRVA